MASLTKSPLYTRTGDRGTTSLVGGSRVPKESPRLEAYGTVDELNSHIGLLDSLVSHDDIHTHLHAIQNILFDIGSYLATPPDSPYLNPQPLSQQQIQAIEHLIDHTDACIPPAHHFILPGGTHEAAQAHVARTVCRRAERRIIALDRQQPITPEVVIFINRLSDYLFVLARWLNFSSHREEIIWTKDCTL